MLAQQWLRRRVPTEVSSILPEKQIAAMRDMLGSELDFNIYYDGMPLAASGSRITDDLIIRLERLEPAKLRFSRELVGDSIAASDIEGFIGSRVRLKASELIKDAGVEPVLSEEVRQVATRKVKELFESCRYLSKVDLDAANDVVTNIVKRTGNLQTAMFKLAELRQHDDYSFQHSVNVCTLGVSVFREYMRTDEQLVDIGMGLLLHDIGKSKLDLRLLTKSGEYTSAERVQMEKHVQHGYNLVKASGDMSDDAKCLVLNHHERVNGSGYGRHLVESQLTIYDMLSAICDVFDAVTTNRVWRGRVDIHRAVNILIQGAGVLFNTRLVNHFVTGIGRFPVGTLVLLSNAEIGVVVQVNSTALTLPKVRIIFDSLGSRVSEPRIIDLHEQQDIYVSRPIDVASTLDVNTLEPQGVTD
jgi:HD-GYP domain-containing protein (c-di-GMP phosphodiesterase class II)